MRLGTPCPPARHTPIDFRLNHHILLVKLPIYTWNVKIMSFIARLAILRASSLRLRKYRAPNALATSSAFRSSSWAFLISLILTNYVFGFTGTFRRYISFLERSLVRRRLFSYFNTAIFTFFRSIDLPAFFKSTIRALLIPLPRRRKRL